MQIFLRVILPHCFLQDKEKENLKLCDFSVCLPVPANIYFGKWDGKEGCSDCKPGVLGNADLPLSLISDTCCFLLQFLAVIGDLRQSTLRPMGFGSVL